MREDTDADTAAPLTVVDREEIWQVLSAFPVKRWALFAVRIVKAHDCPFSGESQRRCAFALHRDQRVGTVGNPITHVAVGVYDDAVA